MSAILSAVPLDYLDLRSLIDAASTGGRFTMLEVTLEPRQIVAPLHRHSREDEYNVVLVGRIGAMLGEEVVFGEPGDVIFKPRNQWHTFWNASDEPARVLEIISPSGFELFFAEFTEDTAPPSPDDAIEIEARYGLEFDFGSAPGLMQEHDVRFGGHLT